jgi:hypothetical protein
MDRQPSRPRAVIERRPTHKKTVMQPTELLPAVALLLLIGGVEFGGSSLLWFITSSVM